jgi:hypothetical protein
VRERKTKPQTDRKTLFINTQKTQRHKQSITFRQESKRETKTHQAQPAANNATQKYEDKTSKTSQDKTKNEQRSRIDKKPREKFNQRHKTTKIQKIRRNIGRQQTITLDVEKYEIQPNERC